MMNFAQARKNMVDSQIHTMGVVSDAILQAYATVPRDRFVSEDKRSIAYSDEDLFVAPGRYLMEPITHARLVQAADPRREDVALDIGGATGYSAAILSSLLSTVVALESEQGLLTQAEAVWRDLSLCNIAGISGDLKEGCPAHAPFNLIFLNGAVASIPQTLMRQLSPGGRLVAVVAKAGDRIGKATLVQRVAEDNFATRVLFDAATPYLPGFEPRKDFVF